MHDRLRFHDAFSTPCHKLTLSNKLANDDDLVIKFALFFELKVFLNVFLVNLMKKLVHQTNFPIRLLDDVLSKMLGLLLAV
jgi:hypothetical protein